MRLRSNQCGHGAGPGGLRASTGTYGVQTASQSRNGEFIYGGAAGLGLDVSLPSNVFVRGDWEYLLFAPILDAHLSINTFRTAVGVLF